MRTLPILIFLLVSVFSSFSQALKTKADIVFTNNDTLSAEIFDAQIRVVQKSIKYRKLDSDNYTTAYPDQIKSVKFADGRLLESIKTDSVYYLLLNQIKGYYNLYSKLESNGVKTYYIRHDKDQPIHLTETFSEKLVNGQREQISNYEYAHQLTKAMADNARICSELSELKFTENQLIAIVKKYNEFKGNDYTNSDNFKKKSAKIVIGVLVNNIFWIGEPAAPGLGMSFDFRRNRPYEKFALHTRLTFNVFEYKNKDTHSMFFSFPLAVSYNYFDQARLRMDVFGGIVPYLAFDSYLSYGKRTSYTTYSSGLYIGTGIDYKIKNSALRFEIAVIPLSVALCYVF